MKVTATTARSQNVVQALTYRPRRTLDDVAPTPTGRAVNVARPAWERYAQSQNRVRAPRRINVDPSIANSYANRRRSGPAMSDPRVRRQLMRLLGQ